MKKLLKPFPALILCLLLAALGGIVCLRLRLHVHQQAVAAAQALYDAGDYRAAQDAYLALGMEQAAADSGEKILAGRYAAAEDMLAGGEFLDAKDAFLALGEYADAPERAAECDLRRAQAYAESGRLADAISLLAELGEQPGAAELLGSCRETLYERALEATYACRMDEAIALWNELGDYRDGRDLKARCEARVAAMLTGTDEPVNYSEYAGRDIGTGILYSHRLGLIFVPKDAGPDTGCMIFYPGGYDEALSNNYLNDYANAPDPPNSLMLLCYANGYGHMTDKVEDSYRVLEQAALEHGIFLHDLVLCGASMGAYTACHAAAQLYDEYGIRAKTVMTFDAGMHWEVESHVMTPAECDSTARAGTRFMLLEFGGVGMNKRAIALMVAHGNDVTVVECAGGGHYGIITDAMSYGLLDWALGKGSLPDNGNYTYYPLDRQSTYPYGV